jgi:glycosyltransferase involved in cell wall biosynthesis
MQKTILIISEYFFPEEFKINEVASDWNQKGYKVTVVTRNPTYPHGRIFNGYKNKWICKDKYNGINIYRVKAVTGYNKSLIKKIFNYLLFMISGSIISLKIGRRYNYIFGFNVGSLTGMVPAIILNKYYNKRVVLWIQDIWPDSIYAYGIKETKINKTILNYFVRSVYSNTSALAISGRGFEEKIRKYTNVDKNIVYLPNWADEFNDKLRPFNFSKKKLIHFTFAGNIGKVQNLENIILAFGKLTKSFSQRAQLNIIGDGSNFTKLNNLVDQKKYNNIIFWGKKPREDMYMYLQSSDYLIVSLVDKPIFSVTIPAKVQTYIAAKKPILAIIKGDTAKLISENNLGYCADPEDINGILESIIMCINTDETEREIFVKNSIELTSTIFNKDDIISGLLSLTMKG